jgi:hypothetical protein
MRRKACGQAYTVRRIAGARRSTPTLGLMMKLRLITAIAVTLLLAGCFKEEWEGFVYPNKNNLSEHINIGIYKSLEECRASALNTLQRVSSISAGDYECGLNCEFRSGMGSLKVCEKTER